MPKVHQRSGFLNYLDSILLMSDIDLGDLNFTKLLLGTLMFLWRDIF
jgi:hypothetical protein